MLVKKLYQYQKVEIKYWTELHMDAVQVATTFTMKHGYND